MTVSSAQFTTEFPEFAAVDPNLVSAKLAAAQLEVDATLAGTLNDEAVYYLTAKKLAKMPSGNTSKLVNKDGSTVYDDELKRLLTMIAFGIRVVGQEAPQPTFTPGLPSVQILGATNASPIVLQLAATSVALISGALVAVAGVTGNTAANGSFFITAIDNTHVSLNGTTGNGAYVSGGTLTPAG